MKFKNSWIIWIILILLLILTFPKSCGHKIPSEFVEYTCAGFQTPFLSQIEKSENPQKWCSGICFSKTKKMIEPNKTEEDITKSPLGGITEPFVKIISVLILIFIVITILKWVSSIKKANRGGEVRVYRNP